MNNADDRCAHMLASGPCGVWRDTHPQIPFKPEFMHAFVEPAPQPAPSGDEAKVRETFATWPRPVCHEIRCCAGCFTRGVCDQIMWDSGYAAGKADGARERREMTKPTPTDIADAFLAGCHRGTRDALAKLEKLRREYAVLERERRVMDKAIEAVRRRK